MKNDNCICGHGKKKHPKVDGFKDNCINKNCKCKKFKLKNHSHLSKQESDKSEDKTNSKRLIYSNSSGSLSDKFQFDVYNSESFGKGTKVISVKSFIRLNKESIKKLKEEFGRMYGTNIRNNFNKIIDKIFGEELSK